MSVTPPPAPGAALLPTVVIKRAITPAISGPSYGQRDERGEFSDSSKAEIRHNPGRFIGFVPFVAAIVLSMVYAGIDSWKRSGRSARDRR